MNDSYDYAPHADQECPYCGGRGEINHGSTAVPYGSTWCNLEDIEICECVEVPE